MTLSDSRSDEELAVAIQGGETALFGELMRRYQPKLERYGRRFLGDGDAIADAVQETFIKAYKNLQGFNAKLTFSPWMYRIAHNVFVNMLRSKSRSPIVAVDLDTFLPHASYDDPADAERDRKDMRQAIDAGLSRVSAHYKEVLILYYLEELSYDEIAEVLRIPRGTVGVRLKRAREALKKHLDPALLP
jgi:RNA polymerase sigma-70 factor, ECF subfamily